MGVPTSEVDYTPAMPRREDHEVHKGHVVGWGGGILVKDPEYDISLKSVMRESLCVMRGRHDETNASRFTQLFANASTDYN